MHPKDVDRMANSADPEEQSDLGLHCLLRPVCPKTLEDHDNFVSGQKEKLDFLDDNEKRFSGDKNKKQGQSKDRPHM